jgi:hypothetical protein
MHLMLNRAFPMVFPGRHGDPVRAATYPDSFRNSPGYKAHIPPSAGDTARLLLGGLPHHGDAAATTRIVA